MKNMISYLIVVFSLFGFQLAYAAGSCNDSDLTVKLSDLKLFNENYTDVLNNLGRSQKCTLVRTGKSGQAALSACKKLNAYVVNPGNPQYVGPGKGDLLNNDLGYFFCMPGADKKALCKHMKSKLSSTMDIDWGYKTTSDGDCECKRKGDPAAAYVSCPLDPTPLQTGESTGCTDPAAKKDSEGICVCKNDESKIVGPGVICSTEVPPPPATENFDPADLDECLADLRTAKKTCSVKGKDAIDQCSKDAPEVKKNIQEAQRVFSIGVDALIAKNAGTGALEACAKMSAAGTGLIEALSLLRKTCKDELENCKKGCEDVKTFSEKTKEQVIAECREKFNSHQPQPKLFTKIHEEKLITMFEQEKDLANNAEKFCKGDVQVADGEMRNFLDSLALGVQKADICKCQLTPGSVNSGATKQDTCDSIVTPLTCMQNLNQPGCSFSSVGCSPGSTVAGCRNPVTAINPNGSGVAMPASGFAGPGFGSSGSGLNAGKVNVGDSDFGGLYDETRPGGSATTTADNGSPFGAASTNGGTSGGAPPSGGDGSGNGSDKEGEGEKSGLAGFFQNAKGGIASLFGGGPNEKGNAVKKPGNKAFKNDVNGFRPKGNVRGMANASEVGGKNRDIWKTMNERYTDQYHTFITVENPSK